MIFALPLSMASSSSVTSVAPAQSVLAKDFRLPPDSLEDADVVYHSERLRTRAHVIRAPPSNALLHSWRDIF